MRKITRDEFYRNYLLSNCSDMKKRFGFSTEILDRLNDFICCCRDHNSKVYFVQFVLKFPRRHPKDQVDRGGTLSKLLEAVVRKYKRKMPARKFHRDGRQKISLPLYLWVREMSESGQFHYHLVMAFDGNRVQYPGEIQSYVNRLWQRYFPEEPGVAPLDYGYSRSNGWSQYGDVFKHGGLMIKHHWDHEIVVGEYRKLFTVLSYYSKMYSKFQEPASTGKSKNYSCSLAIPRYNELLEDVDARVRAHKGKMGVRQAKLGGSGKYLGLLSDFQDAVYQKKIMRRIQLTGKKENGVTANSRQAKDVTYWETQCGTYKFRFVDDEALRHKENGPDMLLVTGDGVAEPFLNIANSHPKHSSKHAHYEGLIYGEQVEVKLHPISGELRYISFVRRPDSVIKQLEGQGYYGG